MPPTPDHFDAIAADYDGSLPGHVVEHYLGKRVAFLAGAFPAGARLLDLGCGTGTLAARMAAVGFRVTGTDLSLGMLAGAAGKGVAAARARAEGLPFADGAFDGAFSVAVLHHLRTREAVAAAIAEALRVVRPGGRAVLWDHNPLNPYWPLLMARVPQDDGSERLVGRGEIAAAVVRGGGAVARAVRLGFVPDFVPPALLPAARGLERLLEALPPARWLAAHNVVVARRR